MGEEIASMLDEEYKRTLEDLAYVESGSAEAKWELEKLCELHKQRMNEAKLNSENLESSEEVELKKIQIKEGKKDRIVKIVLEGVAIIVPIAASSYWMAKGLKFEESGTYCSRTGQWLSNHFKLFRK